MSHFRGSELQNYFTKILEDDLKALIKPQYVDQIPKAVKGTVGALLDKKTELDNQAEICRMLGKHQPTNLPLAVAANFVFCRFVSH